MCTCNIIYNVYNYILVRVAHHMFVAVWDMQHYCNIYNTWPVGRFQNVGGRKLDSTDNYNKAWGLGPA